MDPNMPGAEEQLNPLILLIAALLIIVPFWFIFSKAGYSKWLSLLMVVPILNLVMLYFLAFSQWPVLKEARVIKNNNHIPPSTDDRRL